LFSFFFFFFFYIIREENRDHLHAQVLVRGS
jgi:hypothetical protein